MKHMSFVLIACVVAITVFGSPKVAFAQNEFVRGDVNTDGRVSISDSLMLRRWLFNGDRPPPCLDAADVSDRANVDIRDQIKILQFAFLGGGSPPPNPFPDAGADPTDDDAVPCDDYSAVPPEETDDILLDR